MTAGCICLITPTHRQRIIGKTGAVPQTIGQIINNEGMFRGESDRVEIDALGRMVFCKRFSEMFSCLRYLGTGVADVCFLLLQFLLP